MRKLVENSSYVALTLIKYTTCQVDNYEISMTKHHGVIIRRLLNNYTQAAVYNDVDGVVTWIHVITLRGSDFKGIDSDDDYEAMRDVGSDDEIDQDDNPEIRIKEKIEVYNEMNGPESTG